MSQSSKVLSITYEEPLMQTREMILHKAGFDVTSGLGFVEAQALCTERQFDLVIIGHAIPTKDKLALIQCAKQGGARVLCLRNPNDPVLPQADYSTDRTDPDGLIEAIKTLLAQRQPSRSEP